MLDQILFSGFTFSVNIFGSLVFFATAWLHMDSWLMDTKKKTVVIRAIGYFLMSFVFLSNATTLNSEFFVYLKTFAEGVGLVLIAAGLILEPIQKPPSKTNAFLAPFLNLASIFVIPLLYLTITVSFFLKSTKGYEKQIKPAFWAFLMFFVAKSLSILFIYSGSNIVFLSEITKQYGLIHNLVLIINLVGFSILGSWTWNYLRFRTNALLFIIFVGSSLAIFMATTLTFSYLLFRNLQATASEHLKKDVKILNYALDEIKSKSRTNSLAFSENSNIKNLVLEKNTDEIAKLSVDYMISQDLSFLNITDKAGKVIVKAEDNENIGESLGGNSQVKAALSGNTSSAVALNDTTETTIVRIQTVSPILSGENVIGTVVSGYDIDSAFADGIKNVTGLDVSVFAHDTRSATTFLAPDGKTRNTGTKESNKQIIDTVLGEKDDYIGPAVILNQPFYVAYTPLLDTDNKAIGMLFVGSLQSELLKTVNSSIQLTFSISVILMLLSLIPAYLLSSYISKNIKA